METDELYTYEYTYEYTYGLNFYTMAIQECQRT